MAILTPTEEQDLLKKYGAPVHSQILASVQDFSSDEASKVFKYSTMYNAERSDVINNLKSYEAPVQDIGDWNSVIKDSPKTADFLYDPLKMAIVKGNVPELQRMETYWDKLGKSFWEGTKDFARFEISSLKGLLEATRFNDKQINNIEKPAWIQSLYDTTKALSFVGPATNQAGNAAMNALDQAAKSQSLKSEEVVSDAGPVIPIVNKHLGQYGLDFIRTAPQIAAQVAAYASGGKALSGAIMVSQIAGSDYEEELGKYNRDTRTTVTPDRAFTAAMFDAFAQAPLEQLSLNKMFSAIKTKATGWGALKEVAEVIFTESLTEFAQKFPEAITKIWAENPDVGPAGREQKFIDQFWQIFQEGLYEGLVAAPFGAVGGVAKVAGAKYQERKTEAFVQHRDSVQKQIAQSAIAQRSPELIEHFNDKVSDGAMVYVDPVALVNFNQDTLQQLGVEPEQVKKAVETGELVEIPVGRYDVVSAQNPDVHAALKEDIAPDADGLTMRRMKERNRRDIQDVQQELQAQNDELKTTQEEIYNDYRKSGLSEQEAKGIVAALAANARVMSPENAVEYLKTNAPIIKREGVPAKPGLMQKVKRMFQGEFATGKPVTFDYIRNPEKAPRVLNDNFAQSIEPDGRYVNEKDSDYIPLGWETGKITFNNPLVIDWGKGTYQDPDNWKRVLSERYGGKKGRALSKAIIADGYDGIVTKQGKEVSEIVDLRPTVFKQSGEAPRGQIEFPDNGRPVITLFETSDPSTVIHETVGHYFIQNLLEKGADENAPEWMKQDRQRALEFAGIENWETATKEQKIEAHEKLARAAEAYIMEGKAPSLELRTMFRRFAEWLSEVYRSVKNLNVKLNDDIRGVFDRMLATQEEIDQMQAINGYMERLPADVYDKLTDGQKAELERLLANTEERAEAQVRSHLMLFFTADNKHKIAAEEKAATERITAEVKAEPLYVAEAQIEEAFNRKAKNVARAYIGNSPVMAGMEVFTPLDSLETVRKSLIDRGDIEGANKIQKQIDKFKAEDKNEVKELTVDQQFEFEFVAETNGFSSGSELAQNLLAYNTSKVTIENRVEDHMNAFKDTLTDKEAVYKEVQEAMYSDEGALLLATEQQIIEQQLGRVLNRDEARKEAQRLREIARLSAIESIGKLIVDKATRLQTWISAERRAAEKASKALTKGDLQTAREQKAVQLYNHAMVMESLHARRELERMEKYFKKQQKADKKTWKKEQHFVQAAEIMTRFGYYRTDYNRSDRKETLSDWATRMDETMDAVSIADWLLDETIVSVPRQMTIGQVKDVENALRNIKRLATTEDAFYRLFNKADIEEALFNIELVTAGKKDVYIAEPEEPTGFMAKARRSVRSYLFSIKKFSNLVNDMDENKDFGFFYNLLYEPVYQGANEVSNIINELEARQQQDIDTYYPTAQDKKELTKKQYYPALRATVTKQYLLEMASHTGSESNRKVLFGNPPIGLNSSPLWVRGVGDSYNIEETERNVMEFLGRNLTANDWKYVQSSWDNINSLFPKADDLQRRMSGFGLEKVEAKPFVVTLADGSQMNLRGGYFPLKEDSRSSLKAEQRDEESKPLYTEKIRFSNPKTYTGYTKGRTGATYPLDLNPANRFRHMQAVAHDIAFREVITDYRRLIRNKDFKGVIERKFGREAYQNIVDFVASAATGKTEASSSGSKVMNGIANWLRNHTTAAALMFRIKTAVQNVANVAIYGTSVDGFGHIDVMKALINRGALGYWSSPSAFRQMREEVFAKSSFMRDRQKSPDFALSEMLDKAQGNEDRILKYGAALLSETDNLTALPVWMEAYSKQIEEGKSEYEAVRFADTLIERSIGSGRKIDAAPLFRGTAVDRLFTMFQTFFNTQYNAWAREANIQLNEFDALRLINFVASRWLLFVIVSDLLGGDGPGEEDKDKWANKWAKEILGFPLRFFPIFGDAVVVALDKVLGIKSFGYRLTAAQSTLEIPSKVVGSVDNVIEGKRDIADLLETASAAAAIIKPYPDQFNDLFWNGYDMLFNDMEPKAQDIMKRRPRNER